MRSRFISVLSIAVYLLFLVLFIAGCSSVKIASDDDKNLEYEEAGKVVVMSHSPADNKEGALKDSETSKDAEETKSSNNEEPSVSEDNNMIGSSGLSNGNDVTYPPDIMRIMERGKLIVGLYYEDMPPFFMKIEDGSLDGVDIRLAEDIASKFGVEVEFDRRAKTYQELFEMVAREEVDVVIAKFSQTFQRTKAILYTQPYITFRKAILVNSIMAQKAGIIDYPMDYLREADNIKIGVKAKTSYVEYAAELFLNAEIVEYQEWPEVVQALIKGDIIAAMYDENEIIKLVGQNPDIALYANVYVLTDLKDHIAMAVPRESTQLLAWLNAYLQTFDIHMEIDDLVEQYPEIYKEN